jgi:hypothetical protein
MPLRCSKTNYILKNQSGFQEVDLFDTGGGVGSLLPNDPSFASA